MRENRCSESRTSLGCNLTELSNQDADEEMGRWVRARVRLTRLCSRCTLLSQWTLTQWAQIKLPCAGKVSILPQKKKNQGGCVQVHQDHHCRKQFKASPHTFPTCSGTCFFSFSQPHTRNLLWNTSSGVTELSKPVHLGDVILLPVWVWPRLLVRHLPSVPVSDSTHIPHNLHLWPTGRGAAGVEAGDHGLKRQQAL